MISRFIEGKNFSWKTFISAIMYMSQLTFIDTCKVGLLKKVKALGAGPSDQGFGVWHLPHVTHINYVFQGWWMLKHCDL